MEKVQIIFILISSSMLISNSQSTSHTSEKTAKFRVYIHQTLTGPNKTVYEVARSNITLTSPTSFGQVLVLDQLILATPDPSSEMLGRAQGVAIYSSLQELAITVNINLVFTTGEYNGSTICIVGRNPLSKSNNRETPIVGGSGVFRWARGYVISNVYSFDPESKYTVLEYNIYVVYSEQQS
ncbi:hypothetical protein DH2020_025807 [Rehmannia glutinosa]|uniref:Dirigent protein n=1 Tax=Rehmannia glutinosa TaxID=99300 RepID=A0ABR0W1E2_REHGL